MSFVSHSPAEDVRTSGKTIGPAQKTRALIITRQVGVSSEVWVCRQVLGFKQIEPEVVCWERESHEVHPMPGVQVHQLPFRPDSDAGARRWWVRFCNATRGNFYGTIGAESKALERLIRESGAEVILCHFGQTALRVLPAARACGVPVIAHFHGQDLSSALRNRWYRSSLLRNLSRFSSIVVVGSHQKKWMIDHGVPPHRVHLIPCGVPTDFFVPTEERRVHDRVVIAAVSRLVPWKGVAESIRAVALALRHGAEVELNIVGGGAQREDLERLVSELGLQKHVHFLGVQGAEEVRSLFGRSDIFIQHSLTSDSGWQEGFGVSLAEAASMSLPVIATRSGGIPDQVLDGVTGRLVKEKDIISMADAIAELARNPVLRAELGRAGRRRMIQEFDTVRQVEKLEAVMLEASNAARGKAERGTPTRVRSADFPAALLSSSPVLA